MSAPRWPDVYAGILELLPSIPAFKGVAVFDGFPLAKSNPMEWVTVGYVDEDPSGNFSQVRDPSGYATAETGELRCHLSCNSGATAASRTRTRAFELVAAWQTALENDQTIRGHIPEGSAVSLSSQVVGVQNAQGSGMSLLVTVSYATLTFFNPA